VADGGGPRRGPANRSGPGTLPLIVGLGAAQAAFFVAAEPERDAAMRAELVDQAVFAVAVAKGEQPLGQELHPHRRAFVFR